jgi:hypothetical protein
MRKLRLLLATVTALLVGALAASPAQADLGPSQISVEPNAQFVTPFNISVALHVRCDGGLGFVHVTIDQGPPETAFTSHGEAGKDVVCNGQKQEVFVHTPGCCLFDAGKAYATASLFAQSGQAFHSKTVNITF